MTFATLRRGQAAEARAARYLTAKGWKILEKNFRSKGAELDLIAEDGGTLVFVEVKQRSGREKGFPEEAVDARKGKKLYQAAEVYLKTHPWLAGRDCRFDVIAVEGEGEHAVLRHVADALCR